MKNNRWLLFCIATSFFWFSLYGYVPMLSPYSESIGASHKMVGLILGAYGFSQIIFRIPIGIWSDRICRRKPFMIAGLIISVISGLGIWAFPSPWPILYFRFLAGITAATWAIVIVLFTGYFPEHETSKAVGIINSFYASGQVAAMLLCGIAAEYFGLRAPFLIASAGALTGLMLAVGIKEKSAVRSQPIKMSELFEVVKDKDFIFVSILAILAQLIIYATVYGFTPVYAAAIGAANYQLSLLTVISIIPMIVVPLFSGSSLFKKYSERIIIAAGFFVAAISCALMPLIGSIALLYITQAGIGLGRGVVFPLLMALSIRKVQPNKRATTMGVFQALYGLGMSMGPVIVGWLSDIAGLAWGFWAISCFAGVGGLLALRYMKNENLSKNF